MWIHLKKPYDILYYSPRFFPAISGAEFYFLNLAKQQQNSQILCSTSIDFKGIHDSTGLHIDPNHKFYSSYKNIPIHRIPPEYEINHNEFRYLLQKMNLHWDSSYTAILENGPVHIQFLLSQLKKPSYTAELIHSTYLPYATVILALIYAKILKVPSICTPFFHIYNPRYQKSDFTSILKQYDRIICCTTTEKDFIVNNGIKSNKISIIPMGVDPSLYDSPPKTRTGKRKSFREKFGIKSPFVLFCGYKNYEKGAISVLKAAAKGRNQNVLTDLTYVFIGPSSHAFDIELKKTRNSGVKILNITPDNLTGYYDWKKISAFQECELFIMPSRSDAYGITYLEAWASKKPVIGADTPVMREVIQHGKDGLLVEFGNITQIIESIRDLYSNPSSIKEMGWKGYEKTLKNNTWDLVYQKTLNVYDQIGVSKTSN